MSTGIDKQTDGTEKGPHTDSHKCSHLNYNNCATAGLWGKDPVLNKRSWTNWINFLAPNLCQTQKLIPEVKAYRK